jgi:hypothetical protein
MYEITHNVQGLNYVRKFLSNVSAQSSVSFGHSLLYFWDCCARINPSEARTWWSGRQTGRFTNGPEAAGISNTSEPAGRWILKITAEDFLFPVSWDGNWLAFFLALARIFQDMTPWALIKYTRIKLKNNVVPVHGLKIYRGRRGTAPLILILGTRWTRSHTRTPYP